jgi:aryl-alcohol dehydrogenase-like predicted oxidoreductase
MESIPLGNGGPQVSRVGLGLMGMSGIYGPADEAESIATMHAALDAGTTLLDTGPGEEGDCANFRYPTEGREPLDQGT